MTARETEDNLSDFSLMSLFRLEVETQAAELNRYLIEIEQGSWERLSHTERRSHLEILMRAAHSIKGAARIVQIDPAVNMAHALEDRFVAALEKQVQIDTQEVDTLLSGVDLLSRLSAIEEEKLPAQIPAYEVEAKVVAETIASLLAESSKKDKHTDTETNTAKDSAAPVAELAPVAAPEVVDCAKLESTVTQPPSQLSNEGSERTIRISAENLNRLMGLAGESLVEANWLQPFSQSLLQLKRQQQSAIALLESSMQSSEPGSEESASSASTALQAMQSAQHLLAQQLDDLNLFSRRFSQLSDGLYREVVASHMCSFEEGAKGYSRLVRDLAKSCNKQVVLEIEGLKTQVDRDILSKLDAPLVHLITNAVVHGIETAQERRAVGKPELGTARIEALHRSGMLVISVSDDGAGIDLAALRQKIVDKGLTTAAIAEQMLESELLEFLFLPGFSTAGSVDELAGRGFGLDLARTMAQSVGGSLRAMSAPNEGTTFQFQLPLTLSVMRSLLFEVSNEPYALNLARIERVLTLAPEQIHHSENRPYFMMESASKGVKESVNLVCARKLLNYGAATRSDEKIGVVVVGDAGNRYGVQVDRFIEEKELVVRPLDPRLGKIPNVSAAAISERGEPVLILDVADVVRSAEKLVANRGLTSVRWKTAEKLGSEAIASKHSSSKKVLVVDDSMTVRAMEKKLLQNRGYEVAVAVNGAEGWNAVRMDDYDLVVTDIDMPRMSGIELIEQMKRYSPTQHIPVIVVSYKDREEDRQAGLEAGANYYLTKSSFHDDGLINAVVDLVGPAQS